MSITGQEGGMPTRVGASVGDLTAGLFTVIGILSALLVARTQGQGQKVDISMLDSQVALLENAIARYTVTGEIPAPLGNRHPSITPFSSFSARDGYIIIAAGNNRLWEKLCQVLGVPHLARDTRFLDNDSRTRNWDRLKPLLDEAIQQETVDYWINRLEQENIPCGRIQGVDQVLQDPQVLARDMVRKITLQSGMEFTVAGIPYKLSETACEQMLPPPSLGEHTMEVLQQVLGYSTEKVKHLQNKGII